MAQGALGDVDALLAAAKKLRAILCNQVPRGIGLDCALARTRTATHRQRHDDENDADEEGANSCYGPYNL
jgi:hypothetical protein